MFVEGIGLRLVEEYLDMNEETNISLETLLNQVSYKDLEKGYVPSQFAIKFVNFIKLVNGSVGEENKTPIFHYKILDAVAAYPSTLVVCFRGSAKSTLCAEYMFLYLAVFGSIDNFGKVSVAMYVADTMENGAKNLRANIEHRYRRKYKSLFNHRS